MTIAVRPYRSENAEAWDALCHDSLQGTLLHTRRFLSHHGDRFVDHSLLIESDGKCVGLFPAAGDISDKEVVVSHPGATYGGVLHRGPLRGGQMLEALRAICLHYRQQGFRQLIYKATPAFYHRSPAQDDLYALFRLGANRFRCDLSATVDLQLRLPTTERRRRSLRKAKEHGLIISEGVDFLEIFWAILETNLTEKYGTKPVHHVSEIKELSRLFPQTIRCMVVLDGRQVLAGSLFFITKTAYHAQYIASNKEGLERCALDLLFETAISDGVSEGKRWFDFGISNEQQGQFLNESLYKFKCEFGGGGFVHEFYSCELY